MQRTLLAVAGISVLTLAGCEWPTDFGTGLSGFSCRSGCGSSGPTAAPPEDAPAPGFTSVWVETATTGDTTGVGEHRLTVTHREAFEYWARLPLNGRRHLFRYSEENADQYDEGPRTATLATGAVRCRVTSENPRHFTVTHAEPTELTLRFSVAC